MIGMHKVRGSIGLAAVLLTGVSAMPACAQAQAAVKAEAEKNGDIIVTAQRREQALQDVPIAISALGSEELSDRGINDIRALSTAVPSLSITGPGGITAGQLIAIRGMTNQAGAIGIPQTVAVYIDGEYQPGPFSAFFSMDDVQRIEVLRGPQGTLYGRNSSAGAINIITRMPGDELKGGLDLSYGNYNHFIGKGSLSGSLGGGLSAGISASYEKRDGFFTNVVTGNRVGEVESYTVRGKVRYANAEDSFSVVLSADTSKKTGGETVLYNLYSAPVAPTYFGLGPLNPDPYQYRTNAINEARNFGERKSTGGAMTINWKASESLSITSITTLRDEDALFVYDLQGGFPVGGTNPAAAVVTKAGKTDNSFSQELRGHYSSGALDLTLGGNYYRNRETYGIGASLGTLNLPLVSPFDTSTLNAWAIFGQAEFRVTDRLTLTAGLRWNTETRDWTVDYRGALSPITGGATPGLFTTGRIKASTVIPSGGIDFKVSDDVMLYAKISKGYQAPGFNATPGVALPPAQFNAEKLVAYEAGIKSQFADRRITLNLSGFHYDYNDLQVRNTIGVGQTSTTNAGKAKIDGFEASFSARAMEGLTLSGNLSYVDAKYREYCEQALGGSIQVGNPACTTPVISYTTSTGSVITTGGAAGWDRAGNKLVNAPPWQWNLALDYELPLGNAGDLRAHLGYSYSSIYFLNSSNDPLSSTINPTKRLDARLGFRTKMGLEIYAYGKNLTNNTIIDFAVRGSPASVTAHVSDPKTYGLGLQYRF